MCKLIVLRWLAQFEGLHQVQIVKYYSNMIDAWQEIDDAIWKSALYTCRNDEETSSGITYKLR